MKNRLSTYGGYLLRGIEKVNFERSAPNRDSVFAQLKKENPGWEIHIKESHNSVYKGKFGHPKLRKYKE